jgi:hypothetical protein
MTEPIRQRIRFLSAMRGPCCGARALGKTKVNAVTGVLSAQVRRAKTAWSRACRDA